MCECVVTPGSSVLTCPAPHCTSPLACNSQGTWRGGKRGQERLLRLSARRIPRGAPAVCGRVSACASGLNEQTDLLARPHQQQQEKQCASRTRRRWCHPTARSYSLQQEAATCCMHGIHFSGRPKLCWQPTAGRNCAIDDGSAVQHYYSWATLH